MLTDEQKENRKNGLGASDTPILMGYSTFKTPYELYLEKKGLVDCDEETEQQYWGKQIEPLILQRFSEEMNTPVISLDTIYHPDYPFIFANLDGYAPELDAVVEAKMVNVFQRKKWDCALTDGIPFDYLIQIAKQVMLKDARMGYCAVLIGGNEFKYFEYHRDEALEKMILNADIQFWDCVQNNIEPEPVSISDCKLKFNDSRPESTIKANYTIGEKVAQLQMLKVRQKNLSEEEERYKIQLMRYMGNKEILVDSFNTIIATWKKNKKGTRVFNLKD